MERVKLYHVKYCRLLNDKGPAGGHGCDSTVSYGIYRLTAWRKGSTQGGKADERENVLVENVIFWCFFLILWCLLKLSVCVWWCVCVCGAISIVNIDDLCILRAFLHIVVMSRVSGWLLFLSRLERLTRLYIQTQTFSGPCATYVCSKSAALFFPLTEKWPMGKDNNGIDETEQNMIKHSRAKQTNDLQAEVFFFLLITLKWKRNYSHEISTESQVHGNECGVYCITWEKTSILTSVFDFTMEISQLSKWPPWLFLD